MNQTMKLQISDLKPPIMTNPITNQMTATAPQPMTNPMTAPAPPAEGIIPFTPNLTGYDLTDVGNSERVHTHAGTTFHYVSGPGQWLRWNDQRWEFDYDGSITRLFIEVMKITAGQVTTMTDYKQAEAISKYCYQSMNNQKIAAGLKLLKSIRGVTITVNDLDADPWMLGTEDGMIDLKTGVPITPIRSKLITKKIGTSYDAAATCPLWEKFLHTVTAGDAELIQYLKTAVGYTLTGSTRDQCLFFLYGSGQNGKGVFSETIKRLLGDYGQVAPESMFMTDRNQSATNDVARLTGCRMAIAAELEEAATFAEAKIKRLTGGDTITARFLHQEYFDFTPTHHFWISGNHKPAIKGSDHGIWRRIRLIPFHAQITNAEKDPDLVEKLAQELPGILNWALAGCMDWQRDGLRTPQCVTAATEQYRTEEDIVGQFLSERITELSGERVLQISVYQAYQGWAEEVGIKRSMQAKVFNRQLEERGFKRLQSGGARFWLDMFLK
jgi:putative DNA primase/helicase